MEKLKVEQDVGNGRTFGCIPDLERKLSIQPALLLPLRDNGCIVIFDEGVWKKAPLVRSDTSRISGFQYHI